MPAPISIADYNLRWPLLYDREAGLIASALGDRVLRMEHVGSTAVPGLAVKPVIDIVLEVADSALEAAYVPELEGCGYALTIREPEWFEHRLFKRADPAVNLHVFSAGCAEVERMLLFRDWLRGNPADRDLYERTKRALAQQEWERVQDYADAKTAMIDEIVARARASHIRASDGAAYAC